MTSVDQLAAFQAASVSHSNCVLKRHAISELSAAAFNTTTTTTTTAPSSSVAQQRENRSEHETNINTRRDNNVISASSSANAESIIDDLTQVCRDLSSSATSAPDHNILDRVYAVMDRAASMLLLAVQDEQQGERHQHVETVSALCSAVWEKLADGIVTDVTQFLVRTLQFVAMSAAPTSASGADSDERNNDDYVNENEQEMLSSNAPWFKTMTTSILATRRNKKNVDGSSVNVVNGDAVSARLRCLLATRRMIQRLLLRQHQHCHDDDDIDDDTKKTEEQLHEWIVKPIVVDTLLLRIDYHFGADNNNSNDEDKTSSSSASSSEKRKKPEHAVSSSSPFASRPEYVLQYIGSEWLLLHFVLSNFFSASSSFSPSSSSSTSSYVRFAGQDRSIASAVNRLCDQISHTFRCGATDLFSSICIVPTLETLRRQHEAATEFRLPTTTSRSNNDKKHSSSSTVDEQQQQLLRSVPSTPISTSPPASGEKQKAQANLSLLHTLNMLNEFVRQSEFCLDVIMMVQDDSDDWQQTSQQLPVHNRRCRALPCISILSPPPPPSPSPPPPPHVASSSRDQHSINSAANSGTTVAAAVIQAVGEYCTGALSSVADAPKIVRSANDTSVAKILQGLQQPSGVDPQGRRLSIDLLLAGPAVMNNNSASSWTTSHLQQQQQLLIESLGQLHAPQYATTAASLALSLVSNNGQVFEQSLLLQHNNLDSSTPCRLPLFWELFAHKVLREFVFNHIVSQLMGDLTGLSRISAEMMTMLNNNNNNSITGSAHVDGEEDDDEKTNTTSNATVDKLAFFHLITAIIMKLCVPLILFERVFVREIPEMLQSFFPPPAEEGGGLNDDDKNNNSNCMQLYDDALHTLLDRAIIEPFRNASASIKEQVKRMLCVPASASSGHSRILLQVLLTLQQSVLPALGLCGSDVDATSAEEFSADGDEVEEENTGDVVARAVWEMLAPPGVELPSELQRQHRVTASSALPPPPPPPPLPPRTDEAVDEEKQRQPSTATPVHPRVDVVTSTTKNSGNSQETTATDSNTKNKPSVTVPSSSVAPAKKKTFVPTPKSAVKDAKHLSDDDLI